MWGQPPSAVRPGGARRACQNGSYRLDKVVGITNPLDVPHYKAAALQDASKFVVRLSTGNGMNNPLNFSESIQAGISLSERSQRYQHAFAPAFNLCKLNDQLLRSESETTEDHSRPRSEYKRLGN